MTSYRKGYRFELRVWKWLESLGWWVMRSAGSRGLVDLAAFGPAMVFKGFRALKLGKVMLIACRTNRSRFTAKEREELCSLAHRLGHKAFLAYREPKPPWTLHLEELSNSSWLIWKPDEKELPPWYEEPSVEEMATQFFEFCEEEGDHAEPE